MTIGIRPPALSGQLVLRLDSRQLISRLETGQLVFRLELSTVLHCAGFVNHQRA